MICSGKRLLKQEKPYRIEANVQPDIVIDISDEKLWQMKEAYLQISFDEWEYIHKGFSFAYSLPDFSGFCLYASAIAMDHKAVLFSAACGTGKSTHTALWRAYFGAKTLVRMRYLVRKEGKNEG